MEDIYLAGGCLWGVQEFIKYVPGVYQTEAGRSNGLTATIHGEYDGYAECVKVTFDPSIISVQKLIDHLFEIIDPYSLNKQGNDTGIKYRTGIYSQHTHHLDIAKHYIASRDDAEKIALEVLPLTNYVPSEAIHQHHLSHYPENHSLCHIPWSLLRKYKPS